MASLSDLRDGLEAVLADGLGEEWSVKRLPPDEASPPAVIISGFSVRPDAQPGYTVTADLFVIVSRRDVTQIDALDAAVDPNVDGSVPAIIAADPSLGGKVSSTAYLSTGEYREIDVAGTPMYGATVIVEALL